MFDQIKSDKHVSQTLRVVTRSNPIICHDSVRVKSSMPEMTDSRIRHLNSLDVSCVSHIAYN